MGVRMRTPVKMSEFLRRELYTSPKQLNGYFRGGVCDKATAQTAQFRAMGIISEPSRHPKDVPFASEFWWGTYI